MIGRLLSRRFILSGATAVAGAVGLPSVAVASAQTFPASVFDSTAEAPDLITLGADLAAARQRCCEALAAMITARELALKLAPPVPAGLAVPFGILIFGQISWHSLAEPTDILGEPIDLPSFINPKSGRALPVRIPTPYDILRDRQKGRRQFHSGRLAPWEKGEHRRLYDLAVKFEADIEDAREASALNAAEDEVWHANANLRGLALQIAEIEAKTLAGLLIKAQAANAAGAAVDEHDPTGPALRAGLVGASLAIDLERLLAVAS